MKDGWVLCQVTGHPLFIRWARLMGEEDRWLSDPSFADDIKRGNNCPVISERTARWCAERTTQEAVDTLGRAMIPVGLVLSPQQALDHPHIRAAGFMTVGNPSEIVARPPMLGEHTDFVLAERGYDRCASTSRHHLADKGVNLVRRFCVLGIQEQSQVCRQRRLMAQSGRSKTMMFMI